MDPEIVLKAVEGFIQLIEQESAPDEAQLKLALDELVLASNFCTDFIFDERDLPDAPNLEQISDRYILASRFPVYGMCDLPVDFAGNLP